MEKSMAIIPAERMKSMRQRRRARGLRELRLVVADPRSRAVRRRVAKQLAGLDGNRERLRLTSQIMADKPVTIRREWIGRKIGRLDSRDMARLGVALAFVLGLAD
jgi:mRNA-degrading endonuclease toxin of MazEF toxin-antitoxin module